MKRTRDPLYRCAERICQQLAARASGHARRKAERLAHLAESCQVLARHRSRVALAERHGWALAAAKLQSALFADAYRVHEIASELLQFLRSPETIDPPLDALLDDLRELQIEFPNAQFQPKEGRIVVQTEPITLEEIELGPFAIQLHLDRLARDPGSNCFDCLALKPNPASSKASVTHPHVSDDGLCAGDALGPIRLALSQGRISDAFLLVAGVLRAYNPSSPYVSLAEWQGEPCAECGGTVGRSDDLYFCQGCDRDVCDDCLGRCDVCDNACCRGCLEHDSVSDRQCCKNCYQTCSQCNRIVDSGSFDESARLCPECLEAEQEQQTPLPEEPLHESDPSPTPATAAVSPATPGTMAAA